MQFSSIFTYLSCLKTGFQFLNLLLTSHSTDNMAQVTMNYMVHKLVSGMSIFLSETLTSLTNIWFWKFERAHVSSVSVAMQFFNSHEYLRIFKYSLYFVTKENKTKILKLYSHFNANPVYSIPIIRPNNRISTLSSTFHIHFHSKMSDTLSEFIYT